MPKGVRTSKKTKAKILNPKEGFWNQIKLYRGKRYTRHSGYPDRDKALATARKIRKKEKKQAHVSRDKTDRKNYAVWWIRD